MRKYIHVFFYSLLLPKIILLFVRFHLYRFKSFLFCIHSWQIYTAPTILVKQSQRALYVVQRLKNKHFFHVERIRNVAEELIWLLASNISPNNYVCEYILECSAKHVCIMYIYVYSFVVNISVVLFDENWVDMCVTYHFSSSISSMLCLSSTQWNGMMVATINAVNLMITCT